MLEEEGEDQRPRQEMSRNSQESIGKEAVPGHERHKSGGSAHGSRRPQCVQQGCFLQEEGVCGTHEFRDTGGLSTTLLRAGGAAEEGAWEMEAGPGGNEDGCIWRTVSTLSL